MKKRIIILIATIIAITAITTIPAFAVTGFSYYGKYNSAKALACSSAQQCCSSNTTEYQWRSAAVIPTYTPVLNPNSSSGTTKISTGYLWGKGEAKALFNNSNYIVNSASYICEANCLICLDRDTESGSCSYNSNF